MKVMEAVTLFTDTVQFPDLRALDFGEVPRTIRYRIMEMIPFFTRLKVLIIGPGNAGSWIPIKVSLSSSGLDKTIFGFHYRVKLPPNCPVISAS